MKVRLREVVLTGVALVSGAASMLLTGCGAGLLADPVGDTSSASGFHIAGRVHGGAMPIQGANIELWQTSNTGVWNATTNSYKGTASAIGTPVLSAASGYFDFGTQSLTCTAGNYVYLTATGGNTVPGYPNYNVVQVGVIGECPTANQAAYFNNVNVWLSELSTVAAGYALANFITIDTDPATNLQRVNITAPANNNSATPSCKLLSPATSAPLKCTAAGLAHGFANAYNLVDSVTYGANQFPTGTARTTHPSNNQAVVPTTMVNTLGNILQTCVDSGTAQPTPAPAPSVGTPTPFCGTLFGYATPTGGTAPTNTLQAVLNIARNPSMNASSLYTLQPPNHFFSPVMNAAPSAFTLSIFYTGTGLSGDGGITNPADLALDAQDNVYVAYSAAPNGVLSAAMDEFGADGSGVFAGALQATIASPSSLALDANGYAWLTDDSPASLYPLPTTGGVSQFYTSINSAGSQQGTIAQTIAVPKGFSAGLAIDAADNLFVTRATSSTTDPSVYLFSAKNSYASALTGNNVFNFPFQRAAIDSLGNFYGLGSNGTSTEWLILAYGSFGPTCAAATTSLAAAGGLGMAINNTLTNYNAFIPLSQTMDTMNATGSSCSNLANAPNYIGSATTTSKAVGGAVMDGGLNLFWTDKAAGQVFLMANIGGSTNISGATSTSFSPCYLVGGKCVSSSGSKLGSIAVDSSGAMWYLSNGGTYALVQTLGYAAPTWPLLSAELSGVTVK